MGGPKAAMLVNGRPWHQHQIERLNIVGIHVLWVVSPESFGAMLAAKGGGPMPSHTTTGDSRQPMFHSVLAGISVMFPGRPSNARGGLFILPVDVPAPKPEVWKALASSGAVSVPEYDGRRGHPVFLPWRWIGQMVSQGPSFASSRGVTGPARLDALIEQDLVRVPVNDPEIGVNLNTPEDLSAYQAAFR